MFVRDFIHVARPFEIIAPRFLRDPRWLRRIADSAVGEAARTSAAIAESSDRSDDPARRGDPAFRLDRGAVRTRPGSLVVPISWSIGPELPWFPPLSGDLEVAPIGLSRSALVLSASYPGPDLLGALPSEEGSTATLKFPADATPVANEALVQRVVEAGIRSFLQTLARTLEREYPEHPLR